MTFTDDPVAASLRLSAQHAESLSLLAHVNLSGLYDLSILNSVLTSKHEATLSGG